MIIPSKGDIWEFKIPGKRKKRKALGAIYRRRRYLSEDNQPLRVFIAWKRLPKGRYSGIWSKALLQYEHHISTKVDRDTAFAASMVGRTKPPTKEGPI